MERGFEIDRIKFSLTSLNDRPNHAVILARIFTGFSLIEGAVGSLYGILKHQTYALAVDELATLGSNAKRTQAVRALAKAQLPYEEAAALDDLLKRVLNYAPKRNQIAHGIWGAHPEEPQVLYRLPVKEWITFLAAMIPNRADASDIIDELKEHLEEHTIRTLSQIEEEGTQLLEDILLTFNQLALKAVGAIGDHS